jgi:REP element-mobilizing transposase RayT
MTWHTRLCGENLYHHIYAWGNDRHPVFKTDINYDRYLNLLAHYSAKSDVDVIAYALMEWHVHLFIFDRLNKISVFMQNLHGEYAKYFNADTGRVGHVFGERYNNKIVQADNYCIWLSRYIHRQPVEAALVSNPEGYPWTSYRQYLGLEPVVFIRPSIVLSRFSDTTKTQRNIAHDYKEFVLSEQDEPVEWDTIKSRVVGDYAFVRTLAKRCQLNTAGSVRKEDLLLAVSKELGTSVDKFSDPHGREEKELRRDAIKLLYTRHDYKVTQIARLFKISRLSVLKAIR